MIKLRRFLRLTCGRSVLALSLASLAAPLLVRAQAPKPPNQRAKWALVFESGAPPHTLRHYVDPASILATERGRFRYWTKREDWTKVTYYRLEEISCSDTTWHSVAEYVVRRYPATGQSEGKFLTGTISDRSRVVGGNAEFVYERKCGKLGRIPLKPPRGDLPPNKPLLQSPQTLEEGAHVHRHARQS